MYEETRIIRVLDHFYKWGSDGDVTLTEGSDGKFFVAWGLGLGDYVGDHSYSVYEHGSEESARTMFDADFTEEMEHRR
jgi:hypothetical protein